LWFHESVDLTLLLQGEACESRVNRSHPNCTVPNIVLTFARIPGREFLNA
jgi:hypothetical protein